MVTALSDNSDLLNIPQEEPLLIELIKAKYLKFPNASKDNSSSSYKSKINLIFNDMVSRCWSVEIGKIVLLKASFLKKDFFSLW